MTSLPEIRNYVCAVLLSCCCLFARAQQADSGKNKVGSSIKVATYEFPIINGEKTPPGKLTGVMHYDTDLRPTAAWDEKGLFLEYKYDSAGNETEIYFYENFDEKGRRTLSSKSCNRYRQGLVVQIDWYTFSNQQWIQDASTFYEYKFNTKGQITEQKYIDMEKRVSWSAYYEYDKQYKPLRKYYYNREAKLVLPGCYKETRLNKKGDTTQIIFYEQQDGKVIKHETNADRELHFKNRYSDHWQLIEWRDYSDQELPFWTRKYRYDANGLLITTEWYENDLGTTRLKAWTEYRKAP